MSQPQPRHPDGAPAGEQADSPAGRSARNIAAAADSAAEVLERKAISARRRAASFAKGADGESDTARALAELSADGWVVLHDRLLPSGGNIDHLLVGPGGLVVVDSKNWSGAVEIRSNGDLRVGGRTRAQQVAAVATVASMVEQAVQKAGHDVAVRSAMALTQEPPPNGPTRLPAGPLVVGVRDLAASIRATPTTLSGPALDAVMTTAVTAFPSADRTLRDAVLQTASQRKPAPELFERANVFLFVEPWSRSGHKRLYLNDVDGGSLGFKDVRTGEITCTGEQADVVRGVLRDAHAGGLSLSRSALPKIPPRLPGGRMLGHVARLWCNLIIGHHWRRGSKNRLYVTHASHDQGIFELGHIDLATGLLHPSSGEALAKDMREPSRYLELVAERYPGR